MMWRFIWVVCMAVVMTVSLTAEEEEGRTLHFSDDFEGEFAPFISPAGADSKVSGLFPQKWRENSVWQGAEVEVVYDRLTTAVHQGRSSWRIDCRTVKAGRSQMGISPVPLDGKRFIEITFAARSDHASSFRMAINMSGTPWKTYWNTNVGLTSEWQTYRYLVPPSAIDPTSRFQIVLDRPARIDLDSFSISYLEPELVIGDGDPDGNLLFQGAFAAGVAGAWVTEHTDRPEQVYQVDPQELGPSGLPSLRMESDPMLNGRPMVQITQAFRAVGGRKYIASAWLKGSTDGQVAHLRVGPPSAQLWTEPWQKNISLTTNWQRIEFPVELPYSPGGYFLFRITSHAAQPLWLDACQVELGETAAEWSYGGPEPSEVVLSSPKNRGLHLDDANLQARIVVSADTDVTTKLVGSLTDIRGVEQSIPSQVMGKGDRGTPRLFNVALSTEGLAQYGTFLLRVRLENSDGSAVSRWAEYSLSRVRSPKATARSRKTSPFGIHVRYGDSDLQLAKELGFTWVRTLYHSNWDSVQPDKTTWDWDLLDWRFAQLHKYDFSVLGSISGVPRWASTVPESYRAWNAMNFQVDDIAAWAQFSEQISRRYKQLVTHWEIWNEPYWPHFFIAGIDENGKPIHGDAKYFKRMFEASAKAIKRGNRQAQVLWNSGPHENPEWHQEAVKAGLHRLADINAYHVYLRSGLGMVDDHIHHQSALIRSHATARRRPLWLTEGGAAGVLSSNFKDFAPTGHPGAEHAKAAHVIRMYLSVLANGGDRFFLYTHYGYGQWRNYYDNLYQDGTPSAISIGVSNLAQHIEGLEFRERREIGEHASIFYFNDRKKKQSVTVVMPHVPIAQEIELPDKWQVKDQYGNEGVPKIIGTELFYIEGAPLSSVASLLRQQLGK